MADSPTSGKSIAPPARSKAAMEQLLASLPARPSPEQLAALDRAAGQKDAARSRLYWHTDFNAALAEAKASGRPILSLRLLGRLDEELSCANSRFFRKTLYVDPVINALLRDRYVLHWASLRPVPILTIDFGDGRIEKRTITGNSIHYLLLPDGTPADAIPGLVDQETFATELQEFAGLAANLAIGSGSADARVQLAYRAGVTQRAQALLRRDAKPVERKADVAARMAVSKLVLERPTLRATRNPSESVMADTVFNITELRPKILAWLDAGEGADLPKLNERVCRELFLTPLDDAQMGLNPPDESALVGR